MYKIGVMGDHDSIYGFAALGFDTFPVSGEQAKATIKRLAGEGYAVIYVTEKLASELDAEIDKLNKSMLPAIIKIPGVSGNTGAGIEEVKASVEKAVGSDILFQDEN